MTQPDTTTGRIEEERTVPLNTELGHVRCTRRGAGLPNAMTVLPSPSQYEYETFYYRLHARARSDAERSQTNISREWDGDVLRYSFRLVRSKAARARGQLWFCGLWRTLLSHLSLGLLASPHGGRRGGALLCHKHCTASEENVRGGS